MDNLFDIVLDQYEDADAVSSILESVPDGWVRVNDEWRFINPDEHFITFKMGAWYIEHSLKCRIAVMQNCEYHENIGWWLEFDKPELGRFRIEGFNGELPILTRAED